MEKYLSRKSQLLFKIETRGSLTLKTFQKLQPVLDEQEPSVQSAIGRTKAVQVWSWGIKYSPGNWPLRERI